MIYFTSDHHFGHKAIIEYCGRPYDNADHMDAALIAAWNETVNPRDLVYHLGDFTLGGRAAALRYFRQLNGVIRVVPANHDRRWAEAKGAYVSASGERVRLLPPLYTLKTQQAIVVLCHYSMRVWDRSHHGSIHLYGHSHGKLPELGRSTDVGVDAVGIHPISLAQILRRAYGPRPAGPGGDGRDPVAPEQKGSPE